MECSGRVDANFHPAGRSRQRAFCPPSCCRVCFSSRLRCCASVWHCHEARTDAWLRCRTSRQSFTTALVDAGLDEPEAGSRARGLLGGLLEGSMYQLEYFSDELPPQGLAELRRLDEVDARIGQFFDARDIKGLGEWLGSSDGLGSQPLKTSAIQYLGACSVLHVANSQHLIA